MDDYSVSSLIESRNEWSIRLLNILTPMIISGFNAIWKDAFTTAAKHNEQSKYLMTFQNFLSQIPKWSTAIVQAELERIVEKSGCNYLEDLLSCVHVIQLKTLSCVRVGQRQKKVDIEIPSLASFIHNVYTNCARKIYTNVYLFETDVPSLQIQKNNRELEMIIRECIMNTIRDSIPTEKILRAYMDETMEDFVETKEELVQVEDEDGDQDGAKVEDENMGNTTIPNEENTNIEQLNSEEIVEPISTDDLSTSLTVNTDDVEKKNEDATNSFQMKKMDEEISDIEKPSSLKFNDMDEAITTEGVREEVEAPKTIDRLEKISTESFEKRKAEEEDEEEDRLNIGNSVDLEFDEIVSLENPNF